MNFNDNVLSDLPMGLAMALAQNPDAMVKFGNMTPDEKQALINSTHSVNSKAEMRSLVENMVK